MPSKTFLLWASKSARSIAPTALNRAVNPACLLEPDRAALRYGEYQPAPMGRRGPGGQRSGPLPVHSQSQQVEPENVCHSQNGKGEDVSPSRHPVGKNSCAIHGYGGDRGPQRSHRASKLRQMESQTRFFRKFMDRSNKWRSIKNCNFGRDDRDDHIRNLILRKSLIMHQSQRQLLTRRLQDLRLTRMLIGLHRLRGLSPRYRQPASSSSSRSIFHQDSVTRTHSRSITKVDRQSGCAIPMAFQTSRSMRPL